MRARAATFVSRRLGVNNKFELCPREPVTIRDDGGSVDQRRTANRERGHLYILSYRSSIDYGHDVEQPIHAPEKHVPNATGLQRTDRRLSGIEELRHHREYTYHLRLQERIIMAGGWGSSPAHREIISTWPWTIRFFEPVTIKIIKMLVFYSNFPPIIFHTIRNRGYL